MKVIKTGEMPDKTKIQIEDWNKDYSFVPFASTLAVYAISKRTNIRSGWRYPEAGEKARFEFDFESEKEARAAFEGLSSGAKTLSDYLRNMGRPEFKEFI